METWKLCFVLVLPLTVCLTNKETLVKTITSEPDVTQICSNSTSDIITLIVCKIRTEKREECPLLYHPERGFEEDCDSRFKLMMKSQTVFLRLTNLTPVDSGLYTCQCSKLSGTYILNLNVTVEDFSIIASYEDGGGDSSTQRQLLFALIGLTMGTIITGVILGLIYRRMRHRQQAQAPSSRPDLGPEDIEPYSTFMRKESGLYSTARVNVTNSNTNNSNMLIREDSHAGNVL